MLSLSTARSSLEEMLESLRRNEEDESPKDLPPALPPRPKPTSRARLPSAKRPLPTSSEAAKSSLNGCVKKEEMGGERGNDFGAKKVKEMEAGKSPYVVAASDEMEHNKILEERECAKLGNLRRPGSASDDKHFVKKNLHVWYLRDNGLWESGQIKSTSGEKASVLLSDGIVETVPTQDLLPANPQILDGVDDLVQLNYLNEPSVLHNLRSRYFQDKIYTKAGPVLVAVNPFKDVQLYGNDLVSAYRHKLLDSPHVYAVADAAYNAMLTDEINQSIIISGESGAGKTETAKIAMQYLTALGGGDDRIGSKILQTSFILEAFGSAKTARNNNSTRFGKLIEIHFTATGQICSAKIQSFFLEKSRVVQLGEGERSYHIFYQLCSGAPSGLKRMLKLKRASDYNYLNQSDCLEIHNIDDAQRFHIVTGALNSVGISKEDQEHALEMLAAVLWLGNISFIVTDKQNHVEVVSDEAVTNAASLLGCSESQLILALSTRKVQAGKDEVTKTRTLGQAIDARDALAKFIYANLFDWLVEKINFSLSMGKHNTRCSISVLDIYGFESFKKNSFEQFCINYASERLQQHFNRYLFKLEQGEYELDGIDWRKVDFEDNQDCLDLFEKKPDGLISLLDEVSNFPKATDLTLATKFKQQLNSNHCFKGERGGTFSVRHYAGEVLYDTGKFLEKNRDPVHSEFTELLSSCTGQLPQYFASTLLKQAQSLKSTLMQSGVLTQCQKKTFATKFKDQLFELLQHLDSTSPHFIRCIRPNNKQIPGSFEKDLVLQQIQSCRIPEVARISRLGYSIRMTHQEFTRRYGFLLTENATSQDPLSMSIAILHQFGILPEMYQVGHTKLYFRTGQICALEDVRKQVLQGNREVQKAFHGHHARQDFHKLKETVVSLQSFVRGEIARKEYGLLRLEKPDDHSMEVVLIQSVIRGWLTRRHFSHHQNPKLSNVGKPKQGRRTSEVKDHLPPEMMPSVIEELQKRVSLAEETLELKEKENLALREQVQQYEARWSEYESKMKSMEEMWQKQMASLQMSLAAAKNSLVANNTISQPGRLGGTQSPQFYDSEDMSMGTQTPGGSTPIRYVNNGMDDVLSRDTNGGLDPVSHLVKEFEQTKQNFDDEARVIIEVKSGTHSPSLNPVEEFRRLKHRFEAWKKDYKVRLREAKAKVHRLARGEAEKNRRKWWGLKNKRS
ncbi:hypothetical protein ACS0TY_017250 [Phlomoides rotata]